MSSAYNEAVKRILSDVNKFLTVSLKSESLSKVVEKERTRLLDQLQELFGKYDSLAPSTSDDGSASSLKEDESRNTTGSSHGSEDDGYSDNLPDVTVKTLTPDADKIGYLEKKNTGIFSSWKKMYCVLHKNIFYFFKKPGDKKQSGAFSVLGFSVQEAPQNVKDTSKKECSFELVCPGKKSHQFCADSVSDFHSWKAAFSKSQTDAEEPIEDDGEMYEPLDEFANASTRVEPPVVPVVVEPAAPEVADNAGEDDDELIYEPVEDLKSSSPALPSPASKPAPSMPLPPIPTSTADEAPPLPSRDPGETNAAPALPKRNPLPPPPSAEPEKMMRMPTLGTIRHPSEDFENMYYGLYPCKGDTANELSFEPGQIIHVISRDFEAEDWWIGELSGQIGLVPKSFLEPAYQPEL